MLVEKMVCLNFLILFFFLWDGIFSQTQNENDIYVFFFKSDDYFVVIEH